MNKSVEAAPMMGWTDRHGRFLLRSLSRHLGLWTEMISAPALVRRGAARILGADPIADEVVLQLGGSAPDELAQAAWIGERAGYREINLNAGCPSCKVSAGGFGAALMLTPDLAVRCVEAMAEAVDIPVSVKCRIGVDDQDCEKVLPEFIGLLSGAGAARFVIHARKAWLKGLSPKQNRTVPPLNYPLVYEMKSRFSQLPIILNGGIGTLDDVARHLDYMDGVMIGRAAFRDSFMLAELDQRFFSNIKTSKTSFARHEVLGRLVDYAAQNNLPRAVLVRLASGLWTGVRGASYVRRALNQDMDRRSLLEVATGLAA